MTDQQDSKMVVVVRKAMDGYRTLAMGEGPHYIKAADLTDWVKSVHVIAVQLDHCLHCKDNCFPRVAGRLGMALFMIVADAVEQLGRQGDLAAEFSAQGDSSRVVRVPGRDIASAVLPAAAAAVVLRNVERVADDLAVLSVNATVSQSMRHVETRLWAICEAAARSRGHALYPDIFMGIVAEDMRLAAKASGERGKTPDKSATDWLKGMVIDPSLLN